jgi:hypothetical protein
MCSRGVVHGHICKRQKPGDDKDKSIELVGILIWNANFTESSNPTYQYVELDQMVGTLHVVSTRRRNCRCLRCTELGVMWVLVT